MPTFKIYSEGYVITGNRQGAYYVGESQGESFQEACENYYSNRTEGHDYDKKTNSLWGCKLFETLEEAKKSFG
jgi:hypothetical protein